MILVVWALALYTFSTKNKSVYNNHFEWTIILIYINIKILIMEVM